MTFQPNPSTWEDMAKELNPNKDYVLLDADGNFLDYLGYPSATPLDPLPFDEIETFGGISTEQAMQSFQTFKEGLQSAEGKPKRSLLDLLEDEKPMRYMLLDSVGISATAVRDFVLDARARHPTTDDWRLWKWGIETITGKTWEEIAPVIYAEYFGYS